MNIVIVGAGVVGANLAQQLALEAQDISLVDNDQARLEDISGKVDCRTIIGNGETPSVLRKAGIEHADMVIAVTSEDATNIIVCVLAERYGVTHKIARVRNPEYADDGEISALKLPETREDSETKALLRQRSALTGLVDAIINPDEIIVNALQQFVNSPGATEVADFAEGRVQMRKFVVREGTALSGLQMMDLATYTQAEPFLVVAIDRGDETIVPTGTDRILPGDEVTIVMPEGVLPFVLGLIGHTIDEVNKVVITGAGPNAISLANMLEPSVEQVILIEETEEASDEAHERTGSSIVIFGNSTDEDIQQEIGMETADYFIALTDNDEHNLLSCLLAKKNGAKRVAMLVQEVQYMRVLGQIGIDIAVNSRLLTMGAILRYVRRGRILAVAKFHGERAEAIEMIAEPKARIVGKPLKDITMPRGAIIGAVQRGDVVNLPTGNYVIEPGDRVIVFTLNKAIHEVEHLFAKRGLFG